MSGKPIDVLLIEDDQRLAELTAQYLVQNGLRVAIESRGDRALERFHQQQPDIVLLDLMLPGIDGLTLCRELRRVSRVPILMLTALDTDLNQVIGLEAGADDYVAKPVDPIVLLARLRALLRRAGPSAREHDAASRYLAETPDSGTPAPDIRLGSLQVSPKARTVHLAGKLVPMTTQEFELLNLLAQRAGQIVSRNEVFRAVRGIDYNGQDRSADARVSRLRRKLGDSADNPTRIKTIWGKGYLLVPDAWGPEC
ncbi:MAG: response regulator [Proteobacteria bacterium]|nr:response regulator [Pseudomonadota bacterium]MCC6633318.1 response regulator [Gammaproteobacteria bacterium]